MAREEAARLHHEYVGTEHILLGLIREGEGVAATVLRNLRIDPREIVRRVEEVVSPGRSRVPPPYDLPYTSRAKRVLEESMAERRELQHSYVGTEHLLLGLLREDKGIAAQALVEAGLTLADARAETLRLLGTEMPPEAAPADHEAPPPTDAATRSVHRVELTLYYLDGQRFRGSFGTAREAALFLSRLDPPTPR
jgi:ATP-dependent Clp protease ATP-binding subunit ClpC